MTRHNEKEVGLSMVPTDNPTLDAAGIHYLNKNISFESVKDPIGFVLYQNMKTKNVPDHLSLIVSSYGGSVEAAFALIDIMQHSRIPVHTIGLGAIDSCGLLIFMAGKKGTRLLTPNTEVLSHQYSGWFVGKEHDLVAASKGNQLTTDRLMRHYRKHTGLSDKLIREKLLPPSDVWLSAEEAKKLNLCDRIGGIGK